MACDELVRGITVAELAPTFGKLILLLPLEHREASDLVEIAVAASASDEHRFAPCSNCEARELSLNAHSLAPSFDVFRRSKLERSPNDRRSARASH